MSPGELLRKATARPASLLRALARVPPRVLSRLSRATSRLARVASPRRVIVAVSLCAAAALAASQFLTYHGVEVGAPAYNGVALVAPAPQTDRVLAGAAHAWVGIPLAVIAALAALIALRPSRRKAARLVFLAGLAGLAISLIIDLPQGLDAGRAALAFAGARATLENGFYAQLFACALLMLCGALLAGRPRPRRAEASRRPVPAPPARRAAARRTSPAGEGA